VSTADELDGASVLVTGGAGFIGTHVVDALRSTADVTVLDDGSSGDLDAVPDGVACIEADVRDQAAVRAAVAEADVVVHLAAVVSVDESVADPPRSHAVTVDGTLHVLEAARDADARVVLASSAAVYGDPETVPIAEDHRQDPRSPYGLDKLAADRYARLYHDLYGVETVVLRPFNVYGPGQSAEYAGVISVFLEQARAGDPITVHGEGTQTRDFVHVEDVVDAVLLAATTDAVGEAFNVGTGASVTINELAALVRDVTGAESEIVHTDPRPGDIERSEAALTKATERLGFRPRVDLRTGLESLADRT